MAKLLDVPTRKDLLPDDRRSCPVCGSPVRIIRRVGGADGREGYADHYERIPQEQMDSILADQDPRTARELRKARNGKRTVALVGFSPTSCSLAPFDDKNVEIWGLNEEHGFGYMKRWDQWFQMHKAKSFTRTTPVHGVSGHYEWLRHKKGKPVYMQFHYDNIPDSLEYPLDEICKKFFGKVFKGEENAKFFTSTFDYMVALAIYKGFQRIEVYGFEMADDTEYRWQKPGASYWLGVAAGAGVEVYLPAKCQLLWAPLYGYKGIGPHNIPEPD